MSSSELCGCNAQSSYIPSQKTGPDRLCGFSQDVIDARQRIIQGTVRASAGEYLMNKSAVMAYSKNASQLDTGAKSVKKHDSYARYLAKKKGGAVIREESDTKRASIARRGGKVKRFAMFGYCASNCS